MAIEESLLRLSEGNLRFVADNLHRNLQDSGRRKQIIKRQKPFAIVLSCADSRVIPELIFDAGIGELFVVRVAGNIANTSSIASIEYAVSNLGTRLIVVLGHQNCGAVAAAIQGVDAGQNIDHLLTHIKPAIDQFPGKVNANEVVKKNALLTAERLIEGSEIIRNAVESDEVKVVAAYYNLDSGMVDFLK